MEIDVGNQVEMEFASETGSRSQANFSETEPSDDDSEDETDSLDHETISDGEIIKDEEGIDEGQNSQPSMSSAGMKKSAS